MSSGRTLCWKMKTHHVAWDKWRDIVQRTREKKCLPHFHYLNVAACFVAKPIMHFGSPANTLWPECDRGGVISCAGWHTLLSHLGLCRVRTMRPQQSAQRGKKTSSPHEVRASWNTPRLTHKVYWANIFVHTHIHVHKVIMLSVPTCAWSG